MYCAKKSSLVRPKNSLYRFSYNALEIRTMKSRDHNASIIMTSTVIGLSYELQKMFGA